MGQDSWERAGKGKDSREGTVAPFCMLNECNPSPCTSELNSLQNRLPLRQSDVFFGFHRWAVCEMHSWRGFPYPWGNGGAAAVHHVRKHPGVYCLWEGIHCATKNRENTYFQHVGCCSGPLLGSSSEHRTPPSPFGDIPVYLLRNSAHMALVRLMPPFLLLHMLVQCPGLANWSHSNWIQDWVMAQYRSWEIPGTFAEVIRQWVGVGWCGEQIFPIGSPQPIKCKPQIGVCWWSCGICRKNLLKNEGTS